MEEEELQQKEMEIRSMTERYEEDDSDLMAMGIKKGTINSFLEAPYMLTGSCVGALVGFFILMNALPDK
jgi:hypothetical protein